MDEQIREVARAAKAGDLAAVERLVNFAKRSPSLSILETMFDVRGHLIANGYTTHDPVYSPLIWACHSVMDALREQSRQAAYEGWDEIHEEQQRMINKTKEMCVKTPPVYENYAKFKPSWSVMSVL